MKSCPICSQGAPLGNKSQKIAKNHPKALKITSYSGNSLKHIFPQQKSNCCKCRVFGVRLWGGRIFVTAFNEYTHRINIASQLYAHVIQITYHSYKHRTQIIYKSYTNRIQSVYKAYTNHITIV